MPCSAAPLIRLGIPACFGNFASAIADLPGAAALVSANALFNHKRRAFRRVPADLFKGVDTALDSAGFVAMVRYLGYPWCLDQYIALAGSYPWAWWAAPDFCCEPEVARDRVEVGRRVTATAAKLAWAQSVAEDRDVTPPMPVLQGWVPADYLRCADLMARFTALPSLVGIGSVCRRSVAGEAGVVNIVERLHVALPPHVRFHLFGVKGAAAIALRDHPRLASIDSQAFDAHARREAVKRRRRDPSFSCDVAFRIDHMRSWFDGLAPQLAPAGSSRRPIQTSFAFMEIAA